MEKTSKVPFLPLGQREFFIFTHLQQPIHKHHEILPGHYHPLPVPIY